MNTQINEKQLSISGTTGTPPRVTGGIDSPLKAAGLITPPPTKLFDDKRDDELIAAGMHFFCKGHLRAVPGGSK